MKLCEIGKPIVAKKTILESWRDIVGDRDRELIGRYEKNEWRNKEELEFAKKMIERLDIMDVLDPCPSYENKIMIMKWIEHCHEIGIIDPVVRPDGRRSNKELLELEIFLAQYLNF